MSDKAIRVLLVDDDSEDLMLIGDLVLAGFHNSTVVIDKAETYDTAIVLLETKTYDVVLIDYCLAEKNGLDLLRFVKARQPDISAILLTGQSAENIAVEAMKLGAADYLNKGGLTEALISAAIRYAVGISDRERMRKNAENELKRVNEELREWTHKLERRTHQSELIQELGAKLQICLTSSEAYQIVGQSVQKIFPQLLGSLSISRTKQNLFEEVARWGADSANGDAFSADQCRALRRGRSYKTRGVEGQLTCGHIPNRNSGYSICIPLVAQGETIGLFTLQGSASNGEAEIGDEEFREFGQLSETVSEDIALSLANLRLRENLRIQSVRDSLTGLFNRRYMEESLDRELCSASRKQRALSLILLDVNQFKMLNDTVGHDFGDLVLAEIGTFLLRNSRRGDVACRYGGDEFVLILPEVPLQVALEKVKQLQQGFEQLVVASDTEVPIKIGLCMGVSSFPEDGSTARELLVHADKALYRAKGALATFDKGASGRRGRVLGLTASSHSRFLPRATALHSPSSIAANDSPETDQSTADDPVPVAITQKS